ncbi:unnamed protein product [marine sediment metagenome]|uniref:Methyltransferase type 11 domain-containing protein n=1 Tax=marine sediment metagenome TaxID=412755 RepID=X1FAZ3_9ZZZZ
MSRLGGHCFMTNMDKGALDYLVNEFGIKTMVDVGCGPGEMVEYARSLGIVAHGIDGDSSISPDCLHNFDDGPLVIPLVDLAWSIETPYILISVAPL